jgi:hypothetical protein
LATDAVRYALEVIDFTSDPPLNVPDRYKHMVWFALPIDIVMMMLHEDGIDKQTQADIHSIPFIPDDAKVDFLFIEKL